MDLSYEENVDYIRFFEGGEMPENIGPFVQSTLIVLRGVSRLCSMGPWGRMVGVGILFSLGRALYKRNRVVYSGKKIAHQNKNQVINMDKGRQRK